MYQNEIYPIFTNIWIGTKSRLSADSAKSIPGNFDVSKIDPSSGSIFQGNFKRGEKWGEGKKINIDSSWFEGLYDHNVPKGRGAYVWSQGDQYVGDWSNGLFHGVGGNS
jgi:1-phosphatidylinositol-4-phosphate 5-kinase